MKNKILLIFAILLLALAGGYILFVDKSGLDEEINDRVVIPTEKSNKHKISFDVMGCFGCYGCGCTYTIDDSKVYTLNKFDKTKCIYGLDKGQTGKYHDMIGEKLSEESEKVDIYLENEEFNDFLTCLQEYSN